jgi:hypothetical protein
MMWIIFIGQQVMNIGSGPMVPNIQGKNIVFGSTEHLTDANPTERLTQTSQVAKPVFLAFPDPVYRLSVSTRPQAVGTIFKSRLTGSAAGGKFIQTHQKDT